MTQKKVLVLGAGASLAMGYPIGNDLRNYIITSDTDFHNSGENIYNLFSFKENEREFFLEFRKSQMLSIDAFLARRPEFSEIGKKVIAAVLLSREVPNYLHTNMHEDNWCFHFFNKIAANSWDDLNFSKYSVLTFNYDRSLEHYLLSAVCSSYGKTEKAASEKLSTLKILHIYGSVGSTLPNQEEYYPYSPTITPQRIEAAAKCLRVIPEGRNDDPSIEEAKIILEEASQVCFLGFGFDETNINRLAPERTLQKTQIIATCYGMTTAEARRAAYNLKIPDYLPRKNSDFPKGFMHANCITILRETLFLD